MPGTLPLALILLQAAPPAAATAPANSGGERFSILADGCGRIAANNTTGDVVVCGKPGEDTRLPLPAERGPPDRPVPSNPKADGMGALAVAATPCAAQVGGCQVGVDIFGAATSVVRLVQKVVAPSSCCEEPGEATNAAKLVGDVARGVAHAGKRRPDKSNRVAIPLDDAPPAPRPDAITP